MMIETSKQIIGIGDLWSGLPSYKQLETQQGTNIHKNSILKRSAHVVLKQAAKVATSCSYRIFNARLSTHYLKMFLNC